MFKTIVLDDNNNNHNNTNNNHHNNDNSNDQSNDADLSHALVHVPGAGRVEPPANHNIALLAALL